MPASRPTARSPGPPVRSTRSVSIAPRSVSTADDALPAVGGRLGPEARERGPFAQLDAGPLHGERVGADVARRVDVAVRREVAAAAMAVRAEGRADGRRPRPRKATGRRARPPAASRPARGRPARPPRSPPGSGSRARGSRCRSRSGRLAPIEVDRPAAERDSRRRPALGADDPGGPAARALPGDPPLEHDHPCRRRRARRTCSPSHRSCPRRRRRGLPDPRWSSAEDRPAVPRRRRAASRGVTPRRRARPISRQGQPPPRRSRSHRVARSRRRVGRRRTVHAATSRPAASARRSPRASRACHSIEMPRHPRSTRSPIVSGRGVIGVQPARPGRRPGRRSGARVVELEGRDDGPLEPGPAAGHERSNARAPAGRPSARRRGTRGAEPSSGPPRASGSRAPRARRP